MRHSLYILLIVLCSCLNKTKNRVERNEPKDIQPDLTGNWFLDSTNLPFSSPARIPSFCNDLYPGSHFTFTKDSMLRVVAKDSTKECFAYSYSIHGNELTLIEWDMLITFQVQKLTENSLVIRSPYMPDHSISREAGYLLFFSRRDNR